MDWRRRSGRTYSYDSVKSVLQAFGCLAVVLALAVSGLLLATPDSAVGQATGQISGTVVNSQTEQPLEGVQVFVPGEDIGTLTDAEGRYSLRGVPAGSHKIRAQLIGYSTVTKSATVEAGQTATADFAMREQALDLDEIVVTGTAGGARQREVGNAVGQMNVDEEISTSTSQSVDQLMQGQEPGVSVLQGSANAGSGAQIRLRGNVSVSLSNQPLIYVDGVRVRNEGLPANEGPEDGGNSSNTLVSPLTGINPSNIERIEVVRGPAATALYGTEAASGVVQIFTKQGAEGATRWSLGINQGAQWSRKFGPRTSPGEERHPYMRMEPWLRTGHTQRYHASVSGGGGGLRYSLSGTFGNAESVLPNDVEETFAMRGAFSLSPTDELQIETNVNASRNDISNTYSGNSAQSLLLNVFRCDFERDVVANYLGSCAREDINTILDYELTSEVDRFTSGITFRHQLSDLSSRLTLGLDRLSSDMLNHRPFGSPLEREGMISTKRFDNTVLTADLVSTYQIGSTEGFGADVSVGGQLTNRVEHTLSSQGNRLPGPGEPTVSNAAEIFTDESRLQVITGGVFGQSVFSYQDKYFLTTALRLDGNSAFGEDLGIEPYPRASASYVISDEDFWPEFFSQTKLRAALGWAGRAPGAFDAVRTWESIQWAGGSSGFVPENVGNPDLGPERTREAEVGIEGTAWDQRLSFNFTYYNQRTKDALVSVRRPPSRGFQSPQLRNVGSFKATGVEASLNATLIRKDNFRWSLGGDLFTNHSEVLELGNIPTFSVGGAGWVEEGQPLPVIKGWKITNASEHAEPNIEKNQVFGPNLPTHTIGVNTSATLPYDVRVSARGEFLGGHYMRQALTDLLVLRQTAPLCDGITQDLVDGNRDPYTAKWRALCDPSLSWFNMFIYPADYFRMRSLSVQAPVSFAIPAASNATVTLSLRNFWSWINDDFLNFDPEIVGNGGMNRTVREINESVPPPIAFNASLQVTF